MRYNINTARLIFGGVFTSRKGAEMSKIVYATPEESARAIKPDTRTEAQKILYKLQAEQTHDFEMGHDIDNAAIALKLIEQNVELLAMLQKILNSGAWCVSALEMNEDVDGIELGQELLALIAKATGKSK